MERIHRQVVQYAVRYDDKRALAECTFNWLEETVIEFSRSIHKVGRARLLYQPAEVHDVIH